MAGPSNSMRRKDFSIVPTVPDSKSFVNKPQTVVSFIKCFPFFVSCLIFS